MSKSNSPRQLGTVLTATKVLLYKDNKPRHTSTVDNPWMGETIQCHRGLVLVTTTQLEEVWRRSGHNGVFFRALGKEEFAIVKNYPRQTH